MSSFSKRKKISPLFWGQRKSQEKLVKAVRVKFETMKIFLKKVNLKIDFLKIDAEGGELDILKYPGNLFESLLALRSEVSFVNLFYKNKFEKKKFSSGTFAKLNEIITKKGFQLLNFDYTGKGEFYSKFISSDQRYGMLQTTDAIWIKNPIKILNDKNPIKIIKIVAFLFTNNASDLALWILENSYNKHNKFKSLKNSKILRFAQVVCLKHFYKLKWVPGQKIKEHKAFYEKVFDDNYPEMNKFNESLELNPL